MLLSRIHLQSNTCRILSSKYFKLAISAGSWIWCQTMCCVFCLLEDCKTRLIKNCIIYLLTQRHESWLLYIYNYISHVDITINFTPYKVNALPHRKQLIDLQSIGQFETNIGVKRINNIFYFRKPTWYCLSDKRTK